MANRLVWATHAVYGTRQVPLSFQQLYSATWTLLDADDGNPGDSYPGAVNDTELDAKVAALLGPASSSAAAAAARGAFGRAAPVLSDFVYDPPTGNLLSYKEDGIAIVLTYNSDGTVATMKRGTAAAQAFTYSNGNLAGVA